MKDLFSMSVFALFVDKNIVNYDCYKGKPEIIGMLNRKFFWKKNRPVLMYRRPICPLIWFRKQFLITGEVSLYYQLIPSPQETW